MSMLIQAYVFDAYGTLFDVASPVQRHAAALGANAQTLATVWRDRQLQYTWLRSLQGRYVDFEQVTADALDHALEHIGSADPDLRERLLQAYATPRCYDEVGTTLRALRGRGMRTAILSNGTARWLDAAIRANGLDDCFDAVLSVDALRVFKPHPSVYRSAETALGLPATAISFQSSNSWDACSAQAYGMRAVWCNRTGQTPERLSAPPARVVSRLDELLDMT
jgi:2-haloacid dehalogenase